MKKLLLLFAALISAGGCDIGPDDPKTKKSSPVYGNIVTVNSDYLTGSFTKFSTETYTPETLHNGVISSNPAVRSFNNLIYVINQYGADNIQIIDPAQSYKIIAEKSMGVKSNPHDICAVSTGKAYVTRYNEKDLWVINPATLEKTGSIDLSAYADPAASGVCNMDRMYYDNSTKRLFVSVQRLLYYNPTSYSSVIVIDTLTDTVIKEIKLQWTNGGTTVSATNPYTDFISVPASAWKPNVGDSHHHIMISCVGSFGAYYAEDAGIVAVDPIDMECESGYVLAESTLKGEVTSLAYRGDRLYMLSSDMNYKSIVVAYSLSAGTISVINGNSANFPALKVTQGGLLLVCSRDTTRPGILIFDASAKDTPLLQAPVLTGMPPCDVAEVTK